MGVASVTVLLYDHLLSLSDEIEYVWKGKKGPLVYLFFVNRYVTPLGFMINLLAYFSPLWSTELCSQFIPYEGSMTMVGITIAAIMMLIRVYAMYCRTMAVVWVVFVLLVVQVSVNAWLLTKATAVQHIKGGPVHSCTGIFDPYLNPAASSASAYIPLVYDSTVFVLVIWRTLPSRQGNASRILTVLRNDAFLYYGVIFSVTLVLTLMIAFADPGIQNITAQLQLLLTVTMMSKISIHLKKQHKIGETAVTDIHAGVEMSASGEVPAIQSVFPLLPQFSFQAITFGFIGNTGEDARRFNTETSNIAPSERVKDSDEGPGGDHFSMEREERVTDSEEGCATLNEHK